MLVRLFIVTFGLFLSLTAQFASAQSFVGDYSSGGLGALGHIDDTTLQAPSGATPGCNVHQGDEYIKRVSVIPNVSAPTNLGNGFALKTEYSPPSSHLNLILINNRTGVQMKTGGYFSIEPVSLEVQGNHSQGLSINCK